MMSQLPSLEYSGPEKNMKTYLAMFLLQAVVSLSAAERPRLAVLTDIGGDPDDQQSLVRLLVYANESPGPVLPPRRAGTRAGPA
jgi:hypothetical protein